jgi:hypothetical protein
MAARRGTVRGAVLAAVATVLAADACIAKPKHPVPAPEPVRMEIVNHAFADVDVYVLPSSGTSGIRLTTVGGFGKATLTVRPLQLQPGGILQLELHAIGSNRRWLTTALPVTSGEHVMLEIHADANGNMSRSLLYPLPDRDAGGAAPGPAP